MILDEVGLELELFLLKDNKILEPSEYGFPSDEMGFLIELRSEHSDKPEEIIKSLKLLLELTKAKAKRLGFTIANLPYKEVDKEWQEYIARKYHHSKLPDYTRNIYGIRKSHHTGFDKNKATAGLHVHFSKREIIGTEAKLLELPITQIVKTLDEIFFKEIVTAKRILGEWEPKAHGFEYRSLPANCSFEKVTHTCLGILKQLRGKESEGN